MAISIYSFVLFGFFYWFGFVFHRKSAWKLVDMIYYPLGAVGVVLLFFQQSSERNYLELLEQRDTQLSEIRRIENMRPNTDNYRAEDNIIREHGRLLKTVSRMGKACMGAGLADHSCLIAKDLGRITQKYENVFTSGSGTELAVFICNSSMKLMQEVRDSGALPSLIADVMIEHYIQGIEKDFIQFEYGPVNQYVNSFRGIAQQKLDNVIPHVGFTGDKKASILDHYQKSIGYAETILSAFSSCMRAPQAIRSGEYEIWRKKSDGLAKERINIEAAISSLENKNLSNDSATLFSFMVWPYIIILALSLKFGKGVAAVRES